MKCYEHSICKGSRILLLEDFTRGPMPMDFSEWFSAAAALRNCTNPQCGQTPSEKRRDPRELSTWSPQTRPEVPLVRTPSSSPVSWWSRRAWATTYCAAICRCAAEALVELWIVAGCHDGTAQAFQVVIFHLRHHSLGSPKQDTALWHKLRSGTGRPPRRPL